MAGSDKQIFREQALRHYLSPDNLERLMPVTGAIDWLLIVVAGGLLTMVGVWSVVGRVPTVVSARGVILRPHQVIQVQNSIPGRILSLPVSTGKHVKAGEVVATMDQSDILKRIEEERRNLTALEEQDRRKTAADEIQLELQTQQDTMEHTGLEAQRGTLRKSLEDAVSLRPILQSRADTNRKLIAAKLLAVAASQVLDGESGLRDNEARINDYTARLGQIDGQLKQIDTRRAALANQKLGDTAARRNEIARVRRDIETDEFELRRDSNVRCQYSGRVAEVMAAPGQVMPAGGRLLTIEPDDSGTPLVTISYFLLRDGKKIQPGMRAQITPDTVERERFGGIVGVVLSVSPTPITREGAIGIIGNSELVQSLMPEGAYIEVRARLESDPKSWSGYRWSSSRGPDIRITSGLTHVTRITIEERAPYTYLLPIFREASGVY